MKNWPLNWPRVAPSARIAVTTISVAMPIEILSADKRPQLARGHAQQTEHDFH